MNTLLTTYLLMSCILPSTVLYSSLQRTFATRLEPSRLHIAQRCRARRSGTYCSAGERFVDGCAPSNHRVCSSSFNCQQQCVDSSAS
ncbi:hypothetical protein PR003_g14184 [Phytophthora rubi]|uniref:ShKT domain-containing protein n=1 Tax=Phytophthora rubi TaxID=129364 RepID=A0A6A4F083_9STRA|nr:hypothetical protein PR001_g15369 [Phytophthora rubi]KAE9016433.1 hypothetical protein PR002_g13658 [Phytophthora rubi]KAE9333118.1 hypothetical protein PR003_g14184 [Phytophthora rubi]